MSDEPTIGRTEGSPRTDEPSVDTIISELREAYEAATGGPWIGSYPRKTTESAVVSTQDTAIAVLGGVGHKQRKADAELIVKAHNYLPRLLDALEARTTGVADANRTSTERLDEMEANAWEIDRGRTHYQGIKCVYCNVKQLVEEVRRQRTDV